MLGQLVTVGSHDVTVMVSVEHRVEVVYLVVDLVVMGLAVVVAVAGFLVV